MANFFDNNGYVLENAWVPTGEPQKLTKAQQNNIVTARIKDHTLEDGTVIKNIVFMMKTGKPKSFKLSPYNEQFPAGTRIDVSTVAITELTNDEGEVKYTATAEKE
jgi:hypothetical protein